MRALFDVNVIIALLDPDHVFYERAHAWWGANRKWGWASCLITENGVIRIMSNLGSSRWAHFTPADLILRLRTFVRQTNHESWPDDISLRDSAAFAADRIHGSRRVTDLYLLALAAERKGGLTTFDGTIPASAVCDANSANLHTV